MISCLPFTNSERFRHRESTEYARATFSGSREFQPSSARRTFWIADCRVNGGNGGRLMISPLLQSLSQYEPTRVAQSECATTSTYAQTEFSSPVSSDESRSSLALVAIVRTAAMILFSFTILTNSAGLASYGGGRAFTRARSRVRRTGPVNLADPVLSTWHHRPLRLTRDSRTCHFD